MKLRLTPDFFCYSLWGIYDDGSVDNINPNLLPISQELKDKLDYWERQYDSIFDADYPPNSKFLEKDKNKFLEMGEDIYLNLKIELSNNDIEYRIPKDI